jgi:mRNA-degrading endonuclease toxin of MazEF toxin-antitoxin module
MRSIVAGSRAADPRRGEIYEVNFNPAKGREQKGLRPCLVVSGDGLNRSGLGIAIVCPMTSTERATFKWRPKLEVADISPVDPSWSANVSYVQTDQIVTLDTEDGRFQRHLGTVHDAKKLSEVTLWVCQMFRP